MVLYLSGNMWAHRGSLIGVHKYKLQERVPTAMDFGEKIREPIYKICEHFCAEFLRSNILDPKIVRNIVKKFNRTGTIDLRLTKFKQPNRALSKDTKIEVCATAMSAPEMPTSRIAEILNISKSSIWKVLKKQNSMRTN